MRSQDQRQAAQQPDADRKGPRGVLKTQPVQFEEAETTGDRHNAGERSGGKIADGAIQERNDQQNGINSTGIEASPGLVDGLRRFLIRGSTLEHVGGSRAVYEDRLLKTRPKRRSRR